MMVNTKLRGLEDIFNYNVNDLKLFLNVKNPNNIFVHNSYIMPDGNFLVSSFATERIIVEVLSKQSYLMELQYSNWILDALSDKDLLALKDTFGEDKKVVVGALNPGTNEWHFIYNFRRYCFAENLIGTGNCIFTVDRQTPPEITVEDRDIIINSFDFDLPF